MSIHRVTLLFICHHFPHARILWASLPGPILCLQSMLCSGPVLWEKGGWLCLLWWDESWGDETHSGTFASPVLFYICIESIGVTRQVKSQEAWCIGKGRHNRWKQRNLACLQQKTHLILELWLFSGRAKGGGEVWLCDQIGSEERVRNFRLHILVWFVSFSSLYYWNSKLHFTLVIRRMLLISP